VTHLWIGIRLSPFSNAFIRIGELSLLKNMMETMEVLGVDPQDEVEAEAPSAKDPATESGQPTPSGPSAGSGTSSPVRAGTPGTSTPPSYGARRGAYPAITAAPHVHGSSSSLASAEKQDKLGKKKKGLTPEQKAKLEQIQAEQETIRKERVDVLSKKLLEKISVWIETDRSATVTEAFKKKMEVPYPEFVTEISMKPRF
jgi:hypothetical protein